jgi:hypothetical protein
MFQTKRVEEIKTHILCSVTFPENCAVYKIMCNSIAQPGRPLVAVWRVRTACWIPKATHKHLELLFHCSNVYTIALQYYVIRTLPDLLVSEVITAILAF